MDVSTENSSQSVSNRDCSDIIVGKLVIYIESLLAIDALTVVLILRRSTLFIELFELTELLRFGRCASKEK